MIIEKQAFEIQALEKNFDVITDANLKVNYLCSQIVSKYLALHEKLDEDAKDASEATGMDYQPEDMAVNPYKLLDMGMFNKDIKINTKNVTYEETRDLSNELDSYIATAGDYPETIEFKELLGDKKASSILCDLKINLEYTICRIANKEYDFIEIKEVK